VLPAHGAAFPPRPIRQRSQPLQDAAMPETMSAWESQRRFCAVAFKETDVADGAFQADDLVGVWYTEGGEKDAETLDRMSITISVRLRGHSLTVIGDRRLTDERNLENVVWKGVVFF